jgi:hypothetical protein
VDDIETLVQEKKKHLKVKFKAGSPAGEKLQFLEFHLAREVADENAQGIYWPSPHVVAQLILSRDRDTLVKYLDPKGLPTAR